MQRYYSTTTTTPYTRVKLLISSLLALLPRLLVQRILRFSLVARVIAVKVPCIHTLLVYQIMKVRATIAPTITGKSVVAQ